MTDLKKRANEVEKAFAAFAQANKAYWIAYSVYKEQLPWLKPNLFNNVDAAAVMSGAPFPSITPPIDQPNAGNVLRTLRNSVDAAQSLKAKLGISDIRPYIEQIEVISKRGNAAELTDVMVQDPKNHSESKSLYQIIWQWRYEAAAGASTTTHRRSNLTPSREDNIKSLERTTALVTRGVTIDIDSQSKAHEAARVEIALALEHYLKNLPTKEREKADARLGISTQSISLVNDEGSISDRKQLSTALRYYQEREGLEADGKVYTATLENLLHQQKLYSGVYVATLANHQAQKKVGALCSEQTPCSLQDYKGDDPQKRLASSDLNDIRTLFMMLKDQVNKQKPHGTYTEEEHASLKAVFKDGANDVNKERIVAFQKAFGLNSTGIIDKETMGAWAQINLRLKTDHEVDPSEIKAALQNHRPGASPARGKS